MHRTYDVITFISKTLILRRPRVAIFADIIKIVSVFIKTIIQDSRKVKKNYNLCIKIQSLHVFLNVAKFADFW